MIRAHLFALSLTLILNASAADAAVNSFHLDRGRPGCWEEIRGGAMTQAQIAALDPDCQNLRHDYLSSLEQAEKKPGEYLKKLAQALKKSKSVAPPYEAILFATLGRNPDLRKALETRAKVELRLKLPFRYAEAALYRLDGNRCEDKPGYLHPFYREVCTATDSILSTSLNALNKGAEK